MKKIKSVEMALELFIDAGINYYEAMVSEEYKAYKIANKNADIINKTFEYIRDNGKIMELKPLLSHPSSGVSGWAALYLLPIDEEMAIKKMEELRSDEHLDRFRQLEYETTLEEWRSGRMKKWLIPKVLGIPYDVYYSPKTRP